ncbi:MAG: hypothetical protein WBI63_04010 [Coriobacteriia bacterium]
MRVWTLSVADGEIGEAQEAVSPWKVHYHGGGISSVDGVFAQPGSGRSLVVGLRLESESAIAIVPIEPRAGR